MTHGEKMIWAAVFGAEFARMRDEEINDSSSRNGTNYVALAENAAHIAGKAVMGTRKLIEKSHAGYICPIIGFDAAKLLFEFCRLAEPLEKPEGVAIPEAP